MEVAASHGTGIWGRWSEKASFFSHAHSAESSWFCPTPSFSSVTFSLFHCHYSTWDTISASLDCGKGFPPAPPVQTSPLQLIPNPAANLGFLRTCSSLYCSLVWHSILSNLLPPRLPVRHTFWMLGRQALVQEASCPQARFPWMTHGLLQSSQLQHWTHLL